MAVAFFGARIRYQRIKWAGSVFDRRCIRSMAGSHSLLALRFSRTSQPFSILFA
jgi:hypothetical protein